MRALPKQLRPPLVLALCLGASWGVSVLTHYHPLLLFRWRQFFGGLFAGASIAVTVGTLDAALLILRPSALQPQLAERALRRQRETLAMTGAWALVAGCGEECLLRAHIFGWLMEDWFWYALAGNAAVQLLLRLPSRGRSAVLIADVLEGTAYALLFWAQRSVFLLATARTFQYLVSALVCRSDMVCRWLGQGRFTWRSLYELGPHTNSRTTLRV